MTTPTSSDSGSVPRIDTTDRDKAWKERLRRENRNSESRTTQKKPSEEPDDKKRVVDIGHNKDHKPVSTNKWKVRMPNGRTYLYIISESGAMTRREVDDYIPTLRSVPEIDHKHIAEMHEHIQNDKKEPEKKLMEITKSHIYAADAELDRIQKALPPLRWGQTPRYIGEKMCNTPSPSPEPQPMAPAAPAPNMAQQLRESRDNTPLTGRQLAARKTGIPVDTAGLNAMTYEEMKQLAHARTVKSTEDLARKSTAFYRR